MDCIANQRLCNYCGKTIHGRADKKFCGEACRNTSNNLLNSSHNNYVRSIDHRLHKNRRVLHNLLGGRKSGVFTMACLHACGYAFDFCTHTLPAGKYGQIHFCYEFGYCRLDDKRIKVIRKDKLTIRP